MVPDPKAPFAMHQGFGPLLCAAPGSMLAAVAATSAANAIRICRIILLLKVGAPPDSQHLAARLCFIWCAAVDREKRDLTARPAIVRIGCAIPAQPLHRPAALLHRAEAAVGLPTGAG